MWPVAPTPYFAAGAGNDNNRPARWDGNVARCGASAWAGGRRPHNSALLLSCRPRPCVDAPVESWFTADGRGFNAVHGFSYGPAPGAFGPTFRPTLTESRSAATGPAWDVDLAIGRRLNWAGALQYVLWGEMPPPWSGPSLTADRTDIANTCCRPAVRRLSDGARSAADRGTSAAHQSFCEPAATRCHWLDRARNGSTITAIRVAIMDSDGTSWESFPKWMNFTFLHVELRR